MPRPYRTDPTRHLIRIDAVRRACWTGGHGSRSTRAARQLLAVLDRLLTDLSINNKNRDT
jgi:hypothetical protein